MDFGLKLGLVNKLCNFRGVYRCSTKTISKGRVRKVEKCNTCLEDRAQLVKSDEEIKENVLKKVQMILEDFLDLGKTITSNTLFISICCRKSVFLAF